MQTNFLSYPSNIYFFKVNNGSTRRRSKVCSKLTRKTPEQHHWLRSGVFIVDFEHYWVISYFSLVKLPSCVFVWEFSKTLLFFNSNYFVWSN